MGSWFSSCTSKQHTIDRKFDEGPVSWVDAKNGHIPDDAKSCGTDFNGELIYVGRAKFAGALLPGRIVPSKGVCYVGYDRGEHSFGKYQVLVKNQNCNLIWFSATDGEIPGESLQGGYTKDNKPLYVIRMQMYNKAVTVGTIYPWRYNLCSGSYEGKEVCNDEYDILTVEDPVDWVDCEDGAVPRRAEIGGMDSNGQLVYVGRVRYAGGWLPGQIVPSDRMCYFSYDGQEHALRKYQALVKKKCYVLKWTSASYGNIPRDSIKAGTNSIPLYIARIFMEDGTAAIGTVYPGRELCYVACAGQEICRDKYEILSVDEFIIDRSYKKYNMRKKCQ